MNSLGEKIVEGRKKLGMSQELFADKMGVTRQMVSRWELNEATPRMQKIEKISKVLGVSVEDLLNGKEINPSPKPETSDPVATNNFNYKAVIKIVAITLIVLVALYLLYSGYKLVVLNVISSKVSQYQTADNYYFKSEEYVDGVKQNVKEIWYKDGKYKIVMQALGNNQANTSIKYINLNDETSYTINEEEKTYVETRLFSSELYENGKYMYYLFPTIINRDATSYNEYAFGFNFVLIYSKEDRKTLKVNNETIELNKKTNLPMFHSFYMKNNKNTQKNYIYYDIKLDEVDETEVSIPDNYAKIN